MKLEITRYEIERLKKNDLRIYNKIFDHYYPKIAFYCSQFINNTLQGQEIAADILLKLWNERVRFESAEYINHFLYAIARNACINYLKAEQRRQDVLKKLVNIPNEEDAKNLELEAEIAIILHEEIAQLPNRVREVFKLAYYGGLNNQQIAEKLGVTENNVKVNKTKAVQMLRSALLKRNLYVLALLIRLADQLRN
jgi:RNA polymerase sigma-70 factor (ECF subfamily)